MICSTHLYPIYFNVPLIFSEEAAEILHKNKYVQFSNWTLFVLVIRRIRHWIKANKSFTKYYQRNASFLNLFISTDALHVSDGSSAYHQEHKTVHTTSGTCQTDASTCCYRGRDGTNQFRLFHDTRKQQYWLTNTWSCMYNYVLLMMGGGTVWNM